MRVNRTTIVIFLIAIAGGMYYLNSFTSSPTGFVIVNTYPHDSEAFTQGLEVHETKLIESTGLYGQSSLRWVDIETGEVSKSLELSSGYFGEGVTVLNGKIYQLTWKEQTCFVYNSTSYALLGIFSYSGEGWGLTNNGTHLIMSDGSSEIEFRDPETFRVNHTIEVEYDGGPLDNLNELEYVDGVIYSNLWLSDNIVKIDAETGEVVDILDMSSLREGVIDDQVDVLNGIAYNFQSGTFFITGKFWPKMFEVRFE